MFSNFDEDRKENYGSDGMNRFPYQNYIREMLPQHAQVDKGKANANDTVVLKETTRTFTGQNACKYPSHNFSNTRNQTYLFDKAKYTIKEDLANLNQHNQINPKDENRRNQTYFFDKARDTIKQQTVSDDTHSKINPKDENRRNQTYFFDQAKDTVKQQTVDNDEHAMINTKDEGRRNQTYYFDTAKETIKEQTEDNVHDKINLEDQNRRGSTYYFDTAKETIREQTEDNEHDKINPGGQTRFRLHDITGFLNASINALREAAIAKNRAPTLVGMKKIPDKNVIGKYDIFHNQQFDNYAFTKSVNPSVEAPRSIAQQQIGLPTQFYPKYTKDIPQQASRIDSYLVDAFKKNPYTQPLTSWNVPYNPRYPSKEINMNREFKPPTGSQLTCGA